MAPVRSIHSHQSTPTQPFTSPQPSTSSQDSAQQPSTLPSSSHNMQTSPADNTLSTRQQRHRRATEEPIAILAYNKGRSGIGKSDQMASYATSLRKGVKWYRKLTIELLLGVAVLGLYMGKHLRKKIRSFKEELANSLLKRSNNNSEQLRSSTGLSVTHHLITQVNAVGKPTRRYCSSCYKKVKEEKVREVT